MLYLLLRWYHSLWALTVGCFSVGDGAFVPVVISSTSVFSVSGASIHPVLAGAATDSGCFSEFGLLIFPESSPGLKLISSAFAAIFSVAWSLKGRRTRLAPLGIIRWLGVKGQDRE